jgi:hypothetical protein
MRQNQELRQTIAEQADNIARLTSFFSQLTYNADGLLTYGKNTSFLTEARFAAAYRRGIESGHSITDGVNSSSDLHIEWRVAMACWAAKHASHLPGDFVECGTNTGILSLAICEYVDFNSTGKSFYLFDTYQGIPIDQVAVEEHPDYKKQMNDSWYPDCYELALRNFAPYPRARLIRGRVPESLSEVEIGPVSYLSIDMNIAYPERAALEFFWPKLVPGGIIVFDDYAFLEYELQKATHDEFAHARGLEIFALPTGQGLLIKPN